MERKHIVVATVTLCVVSMVALNARLASENRRLTKALTAAEASRLSGFEVETGTKVPDLIGRTHTGEERRLSYEGDGRKTLLLVFSSTCPVCERNWPQWKQIVDAIEGSGTRIVAVDLPSHAPSDYLSRHGARNEWLLRDLDPKLFVAYRFSLVPQAIVIDSTGKVERVRTGSLNSDDVKELIDLTLVRSPQASRTPQP